MRTAKPSWAQGARSWRTGSSEGGFTDEAGHVEDRGEDIPEDGGLGAVIHTEPGRTFQAATGLAGIATFRVTLSPNAQFPGRRTNLKVPSQADIAIREGEVHRNSVAQGVVVIPIGANRTGMVRIRGIRELNIRLRLVDTLLAANPFAVPALIIMPVEAQAVAVRAQRGPMFVITALEAGERLIVMCITTQVNGAQRLEVIMDEAQDVYMPFSGVAQHLANFEVREAAAQIIETR